MIKIKEDITATTEKRERAKTDWIKIQKKLQNC